MSITRDILLASIAAAALAVGCERDHSTRTAERPATAAGRVAEPMASPSPIASAEASPMASPAGELGAGAQPAEGAIAGHDGDDDNDGAHAAADNTGKNERDRDPNKLTPTDQKENETDLTITQKVRQEVVARDALSMTAKNVKIITIDGVVTLRGPVKTDGEKREVASIAQRVTGVKRVDNQLEVASK